MSLKIGDPVFNVQGQAGLVSAKEQRTGKTVVNTDRAELQSGIRHGYLKGLDPKEREAFNQIMDAVKAMPKPEDRVAELKTKIDTMEAGQQSTDGLKMLRYLKSEFFHLMQTQHVNPSTYTVDELNLPALQS